MSPPVRPQERLLIEAVPELPAGRLLCNTAGRAQFAAAYVQGHPSTSATCWFLDLHQQRETERTTASAACNLLLLCAADPPENDCDLIAWTFSKQGDGELAREMLQLAHERLPLGGRFAATIDYPRDQWLHELLRSQYRKVTRRPADDGVLYLATKSEPLRKLKNYSAEFAFRDGDRLIHLRTRPSVFSHRELDGGARALIKAMPAQSGMRVLDLGCGSGAVGVAAALRAPDIQVHATDSNPRAIEATMWAAERNRVSDRLTVVLDCDGTSVPQASFDLVLANPPYYSNFRLAKLFLDIAAKALDVGGELLVVTKSPQWYLAELPSTFRQPMIEQRSGYAVVRTLRQS
jgi:16S rRNA (guanine1207-N2)-methyltransferase